MKRLLPIIILTALVIGCKNKNKVQKVEKTLPANVQASKPEKQEDTGQRLTTNERATIQSANDLTATTVSWSDSLVKIYMAFADNNLLKQSRYDNFPEEWVYDNTIKTDSAVFDTYRIGHDAADEDGRNVRFVVDQWIYIDTAKHQLYEYNVLTEKLKKWWTAEDMKHFFYPVYKLSPKTTAFVVDFRNEINPGLLDSIFNMSCPDEYHYDLTKLPRGWKIYDTTGVYQLLRSAAFEKAARKHYDKEFYVYGTNGYTKARFKDVVFGLDECLSSIVAFCFDNASISSIGQPVFCSTKLIKFAHAGDYNNLENRIDRYLKGNSGDRANNFKTTVLGQVGNLYFTYQDNFSWGQQVNRSGYDIPGRNIWMVDDRTIAGGFWGHNLYLYCD